MRTKRLSRIPLWGRVTGIIAAVLVGVLLSSMVLAATGVGEGGGSSSRHGGNGGAHSSEDHGSRDDHSGGDHSSGSDHGS